MDPYTPCPCGSGKKLKFCCADLAPDIEKVQKMVAGEQPHAALKHLEQLLDVQPERASLLDLRASLELSLHEFDAARQTIERFAVAHPKSTTAHAQQAILNAAVESGTAAIAHLQDALDQLTDEIPVRVLEAIGAVGHALLIEGELVAARAHLLLYAAIAPEEDNQAVELLLRMNLQAGLPLLLREYLLLAECPPGVPWASQFEEATQAASRGRWRRAESLLAQLESSAADAPELIYNLALLRGWLGDTARLAASLHYYATLNVSLDQAVEAEALAELVNPDLTDPAIETVKFSYAINDDEVLDQSFAADNRVEDYPLDPDQLHKDDTPPRSTHILLDRPTPNSGVDLARSDVPHVLAFMSVFGKRTDREARLEVTTDRGETFEQVTMLVGEIASGSIGEQMEEEVVAEKSISEDSLSWRWRLPRDTPPDHRRQLLAEQRREAIFERWTVAPRAALGNKSPQEAVGDQELRIALLASALIIEQAAVDPVELPLFNELRDRLKLPLQEPIDPTDLNIERVPMVRVPRLDLSKMADVHLAKLLDRTVLMGANLATLLVAAELAGRTELDEGVDPTSAFRQLIRLEPDHQLAMKWITRARQWALENNLSVAEWAVQELELSIERGDVENLQNTLDEIRSSHLAVPGVAEATYRLLHAAGLVASPEQTGTPMPNAALPSTVPASADTSNSIWTPGDETPVAGEKKSAIWTP